MGIYRGPGVINDGLVFGYDTGYGIADPGLSTRFYKGKPTVNIASGDAFIHDTAGGTAGSIVDAPEKGPGWKKVTITAIGTNFRVIQFGSYPTMTGNVTYASSFEADWGNLRGKGYSITQDGSGGGNRNYFKNGSYATGSTSPVAIDSTLLDGHFGMNITRTGNHVHVPFIYNTGNTSTSGRNDYFYYKEYQQEAGTIPTPYVDGSRSDTASLIDLKRTTDIDVSNVSFDSTGQPTFDGSNDYITIPGSSGITSDAKTVEIMFKMNGSYSDFSPLVIYANGSSSTNRIWLGLQNNKFRMHGWGTVDPEGTTTISADEWYVCTFSYDKSTQAMKVYTNGVLETSTTNTQGGVTASSSLNWYLGTIPGGWQSVTYSDVDIPIFKLYNRILSDLEVKQNYNAYKNRFDI